MVYEPTDGEVIQNTSVRSATQISQIQHSVITRLFALLVKLICCLFSIKFRMFKAASLNEEHAVKKVVFGIIRGDNF
ncbi:unnamed protein product, partial [Heterobilharzia americana]